MGASKFWLILLAGTALLSPPVYGQVPQSDLETAKELLKSGHPDQSLEMVDPILAKAMIKAAKDPKAACPGEAAAFLQAFSGGKLQFSVENDWCEAMLVKGYALNELKRSTEAADILKTLVGHAPNNSHYLIEYAYTVRANGELERSLGLYKKAEKIAYEFPDAEGAKHWCAAALRGQGYAYTELQRWDDATKAYQRSFKYEPENEIAQHELRYIEEHRPH